jgi:ABC-type spermidine/putrescine transport system permease subunit II
VTNTTNSKNIALLLFVLLVLASIFGPLAVWVFASHMEASTYNRVTGRDITTWEAMWTNLRVDCN